MKEWKNPVILLCAIGISNIGAWIYLIALNLKVLELAGGSPLAVAALYMIGPAAALFTNFWSGSVIDRLNKRKILIVLDLLRAGLVCLLPFTDALPVIYLIVFLLGIANAAFEPASMVYVAMLIRPEQRKRFNAFRSLATSGAFLIGPAAAGLLLVAGTPAFAIWTNAWALAFSAMLVMFLPDVEPDGASWRTFPLSVNTLKEDWLAVRRFSRGNNHVTRVYLVFIVFMVMTTALDSLEVSFATIVLGLSDSQYGVLVSIAGAGIIAGSGLNAAFADRLGVAFLLGAGPLGTAAGYLAYAFSGTFAAAASGFFILAFALGFANTGFQTFCQEAIPSAVMGRVVSVFGLVEALGIIAVTAIFAASAHFTSLQGTVIAGSLCLLAAALALTALFTQPSVETSEN